MLLYWSFPSYEHLPVKRDPLCEMFCRFSRTFKPFRAKANALSTWSAFPNRLLCTELTITLINRQLSTAGISYIYLCMYKVGEGHSPRLIYLLEPFSPSCLSPAPAPCHLMRLRCTSWNKTLTGEATASSAQKALRWTLEYNSGGSRSQSDEIQATKIQSYWAVGAAAQFYGFLFKRPWLGLMQTSSYFNWIS